MKFDTPDAIWDGIVPCPVHQRLMDGCDHCAAEVSARTARLDQMNAEAQKVVTAIQRAGGPPMPSQVVFEARLDVLIDSIITDTKDRLRFEGEVGRRVMLCARDMHAQVSQPTLIVPPSVKGKAGKGLI